MGGLTGPVFQKAWRRLSESQVPAQRGVRQPSPCPPVFRLRGGPRDWQLGLV